MKPYVDFNTEKRRLARDEFEKNIFKLLVNANFGKSMEDVRGHSLVNLVTDPTKFLKLTSKPQIKQWKIINEDAVLVERVKAVVTLNKPIYTGFCILDLSKTLMYDFHYNVIHAKYGNNARLLFTDTDSLCYHISTPDLYSDMASMSEYFDTSDYPTDHALYSTVNKKVVGKMKDECAGTPAIEFVGLRSKMYSLWVSPTKEPKMTAKGIKRGFIEKNVNHDMYLETLQTHKNTYAEFHNFRTQRHTIETVNFYKKCLSAYDDKRHILPDGVSSLAYGHYKLQVMH